MRKIFAVWFLWAQIILTVLLFVFFVLPLFPVTDPWTIAMLFTGCFWIFSSVWYKVDAWVGTETIRSAVPIIAGIISAAMFLIVTNPGPYAPSTAMGMVITIGFGAMFMFDLIDMAIQKTCKS